MVRKHAVLELGSLRDRRIIEPLGPMLRDRDASVRHQVILALGSLTDPQVLDLLKAAYTFEDDAYNRLWITVERLAQGNTSALYHLFTDIAALDATGQRDWDEAIIIALTVANLGELALRPLDQALKHANRRVRWFAVLSLGEMRTARSREMLLSALNDQDPLVRSEAETYLQNQRNN